MNNACHSKKPESKDKILNTLLFIADILFVDFLSRRFIPHLGGELWFVVMSLGTVLTALAMTVLLIGIFSRKIIIFLTPVIALLALALAVR
jgi:hypothetical protein